MKNKKKTKETPHKPLSPTLVEIKISLLEDKVKELQSAFATHKKEAELAFAKMEFIINNPPIYEIGDKVKAIDGDYIVTEREVIQPSGSSFHWNYDYVKINKKKKWFQF